MTGILKSEMKSFERETLKF